MTAAQQKKPVQSLDDETQILAKVPLFRSLDPLKLKLLAFASERVSFSSDEVLFAAGDHGDAAYVILSGTAEVYIGAGDGKREVAKLSANEIVGEIAILCGVPRTATVVAITRLDTLRITKETFYQMVGEAPEMAIEIMRNLARRLEETTNRFGKTPRD
jgi:CRP/FNR family cyclic AMP-dependent transcriptional regulator